MGIDLNTAKYDVAKIYIAAFNRVPDSGGINFWATAYTNGTSLATIADGFVSSQEYANNYPSTLTNSQYVSKIYQNVFARDVDASGNAFWVGALNAGAVTKAGLLNELVNAAMANGSSDGARLTNQASFGIYCADNSVPYTSVSTQLSAITSDAASIETAKSAIGVVVTPPATTAAITISSNGENTDSSSISTTYTATQGEYKYTIKGFSAGDKIDFPSTNTPTVINSDFNDGSVILQFAAGGTTAIVELTGLSAASDASIYSIGSVNTLFGSGTIF